MSPRRSGTNIRNCVCIAIGDNYLEEPPKFDQELEMIEIFLRVADFLRRTPP